MTQFEQTQAHIMVPPPPCLTAEYQAEMLFETFPNKLLVQSSKCAEVDLEHSGRSVKLLQGTLLEPEPNVF